MDNKELIFPSLFHVTSKDIIIQIRRLFSLFNVTAKAMKFGIRETQFFFNNRGINVAKTTFLSTWCQQRNCALSLSGYEYIFFFNPMPHMSLTDFVVFPPGHGRSVTDFSGWDAHEGRLRCPDDVSGDIGGCSARRALKPNFY